MSTQSISIVVLSLDLDNFNEIRSALATDSRAELLSGGNDVEQVHDEVVRLKPSAAIISIGTNADQAIKLIQRLNAKCPATALISAAKETSADLILQSLRAGAREFLRLPVKADELSAVLDRISEFCAEQMKTPKNMGQMTAVFSSKGGCGTSFIATNLAASMAARTVLVDLNLESGDLPLFLSLNPKRSIAEMAARHESLDDGFISACVTPYSANLHLLAAPKELDPIERIKPEHVFKVLKRLRECYEYVVLDPQHSLDPISLMALDQSDNVVLVITLDILGIRSAQRTLQFFDRIGYSKTKVRLVVNRWSKNAGLDLPKLEKLLGKPVFGFLPNDYQTVVDSINLGTPLVESNPNSKMAREIKHLAQILSAGTIQMIEPKPKRSWISFLKRPSPQKE